MIRFATISDAAAVHKIYEPYVLDTATTFEITPPTVKEFEKRITDISSQYPYLVYEHDGEVLGYAYATLYKEREAYKYCVSVSIYLEQAHHANGIGSELYKALFDLLGKQNYLTCVAGITVPNEASVALHRKFGFKEVGTLHNAGYKSGKWNDVLWMEMSLSDYPDMPEPVLSIKEISG